MNDRALGEFGLGTWSSIQSGPDSYSETYVNVRSDQQFQRHTQLFDERAP